MSMARAREAPLYEEPAAPHLGALNGSHCASRVPPCRLRGRLLRVARFPAILAVLVLGACRTEDLLGRGVLVVGLESSPANLDPRFAADAASSRIDQLLHRGLFAKDGSGEVTPDLVERWTMPDPVTYEFRIREGVRFAGGRPLGPEDVLYTFRSLLDPSLGSPLRGAYRNVLAVDCPDPRSVRFRLNGPNASFLVSLDVGIVPGGGGAEGAAAAAPSVPAGAGPFRLLSWNLGYEVRLGVNPDYSGKPARLQELRFRIIPDNTVRILELRKGTVHLVQNDFQPEVLPMLEREGCFRILKGPGTTYSYLGFNLKDPVLRCREVRHAIAHAIDRRAIIDHLLGGLAVPATGVLSPMHWAYEPGVKQYAYDPERAKALLEAAGFPDPDGDGPATRFSLTCKTSQNDLRRRIVEAIQGQLAAVGIEIKIRSYEWGTFFSDIRKQNFQLYTLSWVGVSDPEIYSYLFSSESVPPEGANRGYYENPQVDALLREAGSVSDRSARKELYGRLQKILAEDLPYVSLWYGMNVAVMDGRIRGFELRPNGDLDSLKDVWIE
ncbi:MAG: ABC transporter substrate-binding protein [bacterium]